jgi:hypothetical protein
MSIGPSELVNDIIREFSRGPTRLFRQQSALAWAGKIIERTSNTVTIIHPHAMKLGTVGVSDLGGLTSVIITPDMVGRRIAIDVQIEAKFGTGRATAEQTAYIQTIRQLGGRAGIARSVEDAARIIAGLTPL